MKGVDGGELEMRAQAEELYRNVVDLSPNSIITVDPKGVIKSCNTAATRMLGYSKDEMIGKHFSKIGVLRERDLPKYLKLFVSVLRGKVTKPLELTFYRKDETPLLAEVRVSLLKEGDKTIGLQAISTDITERKQTEEALLESEERYRELTESISDVFFAMDKNLRYTYWNKASEKLMGISAKDAIGKSLTEIFPNIKGTRVEQFYLDVLRTKQHQSFVNEYRLGDKDFVFGIDVYPTKDGLSVFVKDITERKKAEKALKESEQKLRDIIDTSPDVIVWIDTTGKITLVNKKGFEITRFSEKDLIGKNFMDIEALTQKSKEKILENFMKRIEGIDTPPYEVEVVTKNGEVIPFELSASPIFEGYKIVGTQSVFRDLRERKKMEKKLRQYSEDLEELVQERTEELLESEKRYSVLVEEARDGVAIIQDRKFLFTNNRLAEIVGYSRDELIGVPFLKLADEKSRQLVKERYEHRLRGEEVPSTYEAVAIAKDGERIPIELSATRINYQGRHADLVLVRDIRDRKRMEEERLKLEKLAAVGEVANMVGHDLRNPLQSIEIAVCYLNNELPNLSTSIATRQKTMEMLQVINDSVNYADKIIRDLKDFSTTKVSPLQKININTIVKETLSQVETPENVKLTTELGQLPEIKADKDMIKRIFMNLAVNGIQAMENGGTLKVSTKKTRGFVEVSFKDTGVGIPKENMEKIFTTFFTTKAKGMGLGLPICKKFVESHGGSIELGGEEGEGSTFTVKLPL